jgi:hypothetical protein
LTTAAWKAHALILGGSLSFLMVMSITRTLLDALLVALAAVTAFWWFVP